MNSGFGWKDASEQPPFVAGDICRRFMVAIYEGRDENDKDDWSIFRVDWDAEKGFHNVRPDDDSLINYRLRNGMDRWIEIVPPSQLQIEA